MLIINEHLPPARAELLNRYLACFTFSRICERSFKFSTGLKDWIRSRFQYAKQYNMKWGTPPSVELATKWIQMWEAKYTQILAFFQDKPSKLILVNIDIPNWMEFVSNILEFEKKEVQSTNVSPIMNDSTIVQVLKDTFDTLGYSEEKQNAAMIESTLINLYRNNF